MKNGGIMRREYNEDFINKYSSLEPIKKITNKTITYEPEYILSVCERGLSSKALMFELKKLGFPVELFDDHYFASTVKRFKQRYKKYGDGLLQDRRGLSSTGRPRSEKFEENLSKLSSDKQADYWKRKYEKELAEKEVLKKYMPSCMMKNGTTTVNDKVRTVDRAIQDGIKLCKSELFEMLDLKASTYYAHKHTNLYTKVKSDFDVKLEQIIKVFFNSKNGRVGRRQIKMYLDAQVLQGKLDNLVSINKIRRIMKEQNLYCKVRRRNSYRNIWNDAKESSIAPNILKQQFKSDTPYEKLSTDITYLYYAKGQKAYLSAVKDLATGEIVSYEVLPHMGIELSLNVIDKLPQNKITNKTMIHSDQGVHYTNLVYRMKLKENKIIQSMSRKGHCLDNAPIESFFGHFKDECLYRDCQSFKELQLTVERYINYYNKYRFQWNKKRLTPIQYRNQLIKKSFI